MKLRENASISVDLTKYQEQIPNVLKNILLILFFKEIELFPMCIQLSMFETGKCMQCYLVCKYLFFFFPAKYPFHLISFLTAHFGRKSHLSFRSRLNDTVVETARGTIPGVERKTEERFREHKLFHLSEGRSKTDLIMVHKYLWRKKIPCALKVIIIFCIYIIREMG